MLHCFPQLPGVRCPRQGRKAESGLPLIDQRTRAARAWALPQACAVLPPCLGQHTQSWGTQLRSGQAKDSILARQPPVYSLTGLGKGRPRAPAVRVMNPRDTERGRPPAPGGTNAALHNTAKLQAPREGLGTGELWPGAPSQPLHCTPPPGLAPRLGQGDKQGHWQGLLGHGVGRRLGAGPAPSSLPRARVGHRPGPECLEPCRTHRRPGWGSRLPPGPNLAAAALGNKPVDGSSLPSLRHSAFQTNRS